MVVDQETEDVHIPLNGMNKVNFEGLQRVVVKDTPFEGVAPAGPNSAVRPGFGKLEVCNSILSEEAVMVCIRKFFIILFLLITTFFHLRIRLL